MATVLDRKVARVGVRGLQTFLLLLGASLGAASARAELEAGSLDVRWNGGSQNCAASPPAPLQVHAYNETTYILRESLCATFEAPFLYLLVGSKRALLIDTGDVADPAKVPLASTVLKLLTTSGGRKPLLVVHTHRHLDHRAGDDQFRDLPDVEVTGFDLESVRRYYSFTDWPNGTAEIQLGERTLDVIPTPGHSETEVSFYDRDTGLFFSGDFLMPARLLIEDAQADLKSAERAAAFAQGHPIRFVLGAHIEMDSRGEVFPWESQFHPDEHDLQLGKEDLLALPAVLRGFNGFYTRSGKFLLMNSMRILVVTALLGALLLLGLVWGLVSYLRRRRRRGAR